MRAALLCLMTLALAACPTASDEAPDAMRPTLDRPPAAAKLPADLRPPND